MLKIRLVYLAAIVAVIIAGLLSRRLSFVPLWVGDLLWALMVYYIVRLIWLKGSITQVALVSLAFCFAIEFSQLYHAPRIDALRQTLFGKLVLGSGFLWGDLVAYVGGIGFGVAVESVFSVWAIKE